MSRARVLSAAAALLVLILLLLKFVGPSVLSRDGSGDGDPEASSITSGLGRSAVDVHGIPPRDASGERTVLRGVVFDEATRAPIAGALLLAHEGIWHEGAAMYAEAATDANGAFELPCRPQATAKIRAKGYTSPGTRMLPCQDGVELLLRAGVAIEGRVVRAGTKTPIAGANVGCTIPENMQPYEELETDADGVFSLSSCAPGALTLFASHAGLAPAWKAVGNVAAGEARRGVVIELASGRLLSGRVVDAAGEPVAGADVVALEGGSWGNAHAIQAGSDGRFETDVGRAKLVVGALVRDGRAARATFPAGEADVEGVELRLPAWNHVLRGRLVGDLTDVEVRALRDWQKDHDAESAADMRDEFWPRFGRFSFYRKAKIEGDRFRVANVEPGHYDLHATSATARGEASAAHDDPNIVVTLEPTAHTSLRITWEDGKPADGFVRMAYSDGEVMARVQDGEAKARMGLPPGELTATFYPPEGAVPAPTTFVTNPGTNDVNWTVSRHSESVLGRVTDATTGQPIAGAQISLTLGSHPQFWSHDEQRFVTSGADGSFTIAVSSLSDMLFVLREGYVSAVVPAHAAGSIALAPGASESDIRRKAPPESKPRPNAPAGKSGPLSLRGDTPQVPFATRVVP